MLPLLETEGTRKEGKELALAHSLLRPWGGRESKAIPLRTVGPQPGIWEPSEKPSLPPGLSYVTVGTVPGREGKWSGLATAFGLSYGPRM